MVRFGQPDDAEQQLKQAKRYVSPFKREFDLSKAIMEFKLATILKPDYYFHLGFVYLLVPEFAAIRQVNVRFEISESVNLAIAQFERAARVSNKYSVQLALAYYFLGDYEKVLRFAGGLQESWEASLPKENVELIFGVLKETRWQMQPRSAMLLLQEIGEFVAKRGKSEPAEFARSVREARWLKMRGAMDNIPLAQPEKARRGLEQAVTYKNLGEYWKAGLVLKQARKFAPSLSWWYGTLCELAR